jgi:hypothetical protein
MTQREQFLLKKSAKAVDILNDIKTKLAGFKEKNFFQKVATIGSLIADIITKVENFNQIMDREESAIKADKTDEIIDNLTAPKA